MSLLRTATRLSALALLALGGCGEGETTPGASDSSPVPGEAAASAFGSSGAVGRAPPLPLWNPARSSLSIRAFVDSIAAARASAAYAPRESLLPERVRELDYAAFRGIQFRADAALPVGEGLQLHLFHPGGGFDLPVDLHLVAEEGARALTFDASRFRYGDEVGGHAIDLPPEARHAGFKLLGPLNAAGRFDEIVSFLGASYFRLLGPGHRYGLSSRGVAVNTAEPEGEEFPDFTAFWIEERPASSGALRIHALLDGPSITGAFHLELHPGDPSGERTVLRVESTLHARRDIRVLGVAPLTSMYLHGTLDRGGDDDVRPRVHDSEGLLVRTQGGEWIWRPLLNRPRVQTTALIDGGPVGFGLVQRTRDFGAYLDLEARYDLRPSEWVRFDPGTEGGRGAVRLVELPSPSEFNDNVVAFWAPDGGLRAGESRSDRYQLIAFDARLESGAIPGGGAVEGESLARVIRTRVGWDALPGQVDPPPRTQRRVILDFAGGALDGLSPEAPVEAVVHSVGGAVEDVRVELLPGGGRRVTFRIRSNGDLRADLRVYLRSETFLSETWSLLLDLDSPD